MAFWLLKSDPETYGLGDLIRNKKTIWDGVKNPVARKNLASMQRGDLCIIYHTGKEKSALGLATVVTSGTSEPAIRFQSRFSRPVTLSELRARPCFRQSPLIRQSRLSVVPLTDEQSRVILDLGGGKP